MAGNNQNYARNIFRKSKVFNDPIHGQIELHPVCVRIIDTPQFQRLRHIKQIGACYLVYLGASHNRFEHSIGTCHLAGKLMKALRERQPEEAIDNRDILCVEIAALCHDMGQGPFSHIFEKRFMPRMGKRFKHEETARRMFEYMLEDNGGKVKNDIQEIIRKCGAENFLEFEDKDFTFIKEMIDTPKDLSKDEPWPYQGRGEEKSFMYEIVANKRNGIDVDKWDYLARDSYMLGMKISFEHDRCIMSARILKGNGSYRSDDRDRNIESGDGRGSPTVERKQICYREKVKKKNFVELRECQRLVRYVLREDYVAQKSIRTQDSQDNWDDEQLWIMEALELANDTVWFQGIDKLYRISDAADDMKAFTQLTDDVFHVILCSPTYSFAEVDVSQMSSLPSFEPGAENRKRNFIEAKNILNNVLNRRLFKYVIGTQIKGDSIQFDKEEFEDTYLGRLSNLQGNTTINYDVIALDYGMKNRDPMENVRFYKKDSDQHSIKLKRNQVSFVLPDTFAENILSIYYWENDQNDNEANVEHIKSLFRRWCEDKGLPLPTGTRHEDTLPKSLQTSDETTQESSTGDLENKRLVEPDIVSANEEHEDSESSSSFGGYEVRPSALDESGEH